MYIGYIFPACMYHGYIQCTTILQGQYEWLIPFQLINKMISYKLIDCSVTNTNNAY